MSTNSERRDLDNHLRAHYAAQRLPAERVARILAVSDTVAGPASWWRRPQWLAAAAALVLLIGGAGFWWRAPVRMTARVAAEVAHNHLKGEAPEVQADRFGPIQLALAKLYFPLAPSAAHPLPDRLTLVGGRYCSVQGEPAAQIRLLEPDGHPCTLYVTRSTGNRLASVRPGEYEAAGVRVRIWHDEGRLFAMAL
ncbi:MAG: hypothetical protein O2968_23155 [Acidobacteria bacterium]|nr:hypothetical protein [Acidobacteriota bacterium]